MKLPSELQNVTLDALAGMLERMHKNVADMRQLLATGRMDLLMLGALVHAPLASRLALMLHALEVNSHQVNSTGATPASTGTRPRRLRLVPPPDGPEAA
jgi:hypothetical protein